MDAPLTSANLVAWLHDAGHDSERPAIEAGDRVLTRRQLFAAADAFAQMIRNDGAGAGPVAIVGANGIAYLVALFGALASGRAVAEINHHEAPERIARLLSGLAPSVLVVDREAAAWETTGARVIAYAEVDALTGLEPRDPAPAAPVRPDDVAFIVFTSGTTGDPKGVMLSHANVRAVTLAILDYLPLQADDRYDLVLPLFHTYAKSVVMTTLRAGGTVILDDGFADLRAFVLGLAAKRVTAWSGVPYHVNLFVRRAPLESHDLSALRIVTVSGSHLPQATLAELRAKLPAVRPYFMYGLTESCTRACAMPPERLADKPGSCGRPIRGVRLRIVDDEGRDLPPGATGEVLIAGPNVMLGYWNEPELTRETLRDGWLYTGDLGRVDDEGFLYLVGRKRDLIKCAGERISAVEIEEALLAHPGVLEASVTGAPHDVLGEIASAFVVRRDGALSEADLRAWCAARLTHHKIPRAFTFLDELPKTASGKVQKHRLLGGA